MILHSSTLLNCIILFCVIIAPVFVKAQSETMVSGTITDARTQKHLSNVNVFVVELGAGTISDNKGCYNLTLPQNKTFTLVFSHLGYASYEKKFHTKSRTNQHIDVVLFDTILTYEPIDIFAKKEGSNFQQTIRVNSIKALEIKQAPVRNINTLLDYASGVNANNTTGIFSSRVVVTMRGMPANDQSRTLVVLDGMPLNKSDGGSVNWNFVNKNNIEEINIIKGPGPAKYGSGAMGGVIELISKKPNEGISGFVDAEYGSMNTISSNFNLSGYSKQLKGNSAFLWAITGNARNSDGYISTPEQFWTIEDSILVPSYLKEYSGSVKLGYKLSQKHTIDAQLSYFDDMRGNGVQVFDNYGAFSKHKTVSFNGNYLGSFEKWNCKVQVFGNQENYFRTYEYMKQGEYSLYEADAIRNDKGLLVDMNALAINNHKISLGINGKAGSVDGRDTYFTSTDIISNAGKMNTLSVYIQDELSLFQDKLLINAGLRYDYATFYDALFAIKYPSYTVVFYEKFAFSNIENKKWDALSPRFSLRFKTGDNSRIFAAVARGFKAPILDDMTRTGRRRGTFSVANPNLKPEFVNTIEIGGDKNILKNLMLSVSLFHSIGKDFMYFTSTGDSVNMGYRLAPIITRENIGKVKIMGSELEVKYSHSEQFSAFFNYTFTHAHIIEHKVLNEKADSNLTGKYLTDIPNHKAAIGIRWSNKFIAPSLMVKYLGETWINEWNTFENEYFFTDKFPDYFILNFRIEKEFGGTLLAALSIENLLNKIFIDDRLQQCPGRMYFVQLRYQFSNKQ